MSCRLSTSIVPSHYSLDYISLDFNGPSYKFSGKVEISISVDGSKDTNSITLHSIELALEYASIQSDGETVGSQVEANSFNYSIKNETGEGWGERSDSMPPIKNIQLITALLAYTAYPCN